MPTERLNGKNIILSGGSRGLGRALVEEFTRQGAKVFFTYLSDESAAKNLEDSLPMGSTRAFQADVRDRGSLLKLREYFHSEKINIDIIVNNAGVSQAYPFPLMSEEDWKKVFDTNVLGVFNFTHTFLPMLVRKKRGHVLNIGSLAGSKILAAPVHYCASKAAVQSFTATLAKEVGRYNIQVNCLAPGLLEDGVAKQVPEESLQEFLQHLALGRAGTFKEIAKYASFIVSDENSYMTGATLVVDGGF